MITKRIRPLSAADATGVAPASEDAPVAATGAAVAPRADDDRDERFAEGIRTLRVGGTSIQLSERILMVAGGIIAPVGLLLVLLGWVGASRTPYLFEQVPYLISGGLFGLALVFLGAFFYFTHWLTALVKEHRTQSAALLSAIESLREQLVPSPLVAPLGAAAANGRDAGEGAEVLVATDHGTMAHRPDCVVVAGKSGLRQVHASDGLAACKLCEPYST